MMIEHILLADEVSWLLVVDTFVFRTTSAELQGASYYQTLLTAILELDDVVPVVLGAAETVD